MGKGGSGTEKRKDAAMSSTSATACPMLTAPATRAAGSGGWVLITVIMPIPQESHNLAIIISLNG
jgi:hypothetical protein